MKGNKGIFMKELIKKDKINEFFKVKLVKFFKEHGMFILVSLILLWVSLLLIQMADNYIMHDPTNQKETTMLIGLFNNNFGKIATGVTTALLIINMIIFIVIGKKYKTICNYCWNRKYFCAGK